MDYCAFGEEVNYKIDETREWRKGLEITRIAVIFLYTSWRVKNCSDFIELRFHEKFLKMGKYYIGIWLFID